MLTVESDQGFLEPNFWNLSQQNYIKTLQQLRNYLHSQYRKHISLTSTPKVTQRQLNTKVAQLLHNPPHKKHPKKPKKQLYPKLRLLKCKKTPKTKKNKNTLPFLKWCGASNEFCRPAYRRSWCLGNNTFRKYGGVSKYCRLRTKNDIACVSEGSSIQLGRSVWSS